MRMLYCATKEGNDLRLLGEDACKTKEKPIKMRRCHQLKPCFSQYFAGEWKKVSLDVYYDPYSKNWSGP